MDVNSVLNEWFERVSQASDSPKALAELAEEMKAGEEQLAEAVVSAYGVDRVNPIASLVVNQLTFLQTLNLDADEYYHKLWGIIDESILLESPEEKALVLGIALTCPGMPYQKANAISMSDEEYSNRLAKLAGQIRDMMGMLNRRFPQKTEGASSVLDVIEQLDDKRDRAVMMAVLLETVKTQGITIQQIAPPSPIQPVG